MLVSVIMPAYNAQSYIKEAIQSILNQTYQNFELIIINDGSTDNTEKIILSFNDARIVYVKFEQNKGLVNALNTAIDLAKGAYIFRMDADDICFPTRLEKQLDFLLKNPDIDLLGSQAIFFNKEPHNRIGNSGFVFNSSLVIENMLLLCSPYIHPTIVFKNKNDNFSQLKYQIGITYGEDYEFFTRYSGSIQFGFYNETVLLYRFHESANRLTGLNNLKKNKSSTCQIRKKYFEYKKIYISQKLLDNYENQFYNDGILNKWTCKLTMLFFLKMYDYYSEQNLSAAEFKFLKQWLSRSFYNFFYRYTKIGSYGYMMYINFGFSKFPFSLKQHLKFFLKCLFKK